MSDGVRHWGDGPREVLMLHCSLAQGSAWKGVAARLPGGLHLTAPDIVGHGDGPDLDPARDLHDQCFGAVLPHLPAGPLTLSATVSARPWRCGWPSKCRIASAA